MITCSSSDKKIKHFLTISNVMFIQSREHFLKCHLIFIVLFKNGMNEITSVLLGKYNT